MNTILQYPFSFLQTNTYLYPPNLIVINTSLRNIEKIAKETIWSGCIISKPYKVCDYRPAFGEMFTEYLREYDFWGHCDTDLIFGNIRKFITDDVLERYDRISTDGHFTLYRNTSKVNAIYKKAGDYRIIFTEQHPFGFDEWGTNHQGTTIYWKNHLVDRLYQKKFYDDIDPYHYSFFSWQIYNYDLEIKNLMFSYDKGSLYRCGTKNGSMIKNEIMYVHIQKRPITIKTKVTSQFSIVPPGKIIPFVDNITYSYLKWHIKDCKLRTYYIRLMNKVYQLFGKGYYSNQVLFPEQSMYPK